MSRTAEPDHVHGYETCTSYASGHIHYMFGTTGNEAKTGTNHVHYLQGTTTFDNGHVHCYSGVTGPAIYLPSGDHIHRFCGITTIDHCHSHAYNASTGCSIYRHLFNAAYR